MGRLNKGRLDLINITPLLELKDLLGLTATEIAELLGVTRTHYYRYTDEGKLPFFRFQSFVNAIKLSITQDAIERLHRIDKIINDFDEDEYC
jgi:transcriptional regulator with XRE-family HTH domain